MTTAGASDVTDPDVLERRFRAARDDLSAGRYGEAYRGFGDLLADRLAAFGTAARLTEADRLIAEQLAGLAGLFGDHATVDDLLTACAELSRRAGNPLGMRHLLVTRLHAALGAEQLDRARETLADLQTAWLGPLDTVDPSPAGLDRFDAQLDWRDAEPAARAMIAGRLHVGLGWWLYANGQYGDAIGCLEHAVRWSRRAPSGDAEELRIGAELHLARARLGIGDLAGCTAGLDAIEAGLAPPRRVAARIEHLSLRARVALIRGDFGAALRSAEAIVAVARAGGFAQALAIARMNLAQALILVNHTALATRLLDACAADETVAASPGLAGRLALLRALAGARAASFAEGLPLAASVTETVRGRDGPRGGGDAPAPAAPPAAPANGDFLELFNDRATLLQWCLGQGDVAGAQRRLEALRAQFAETDSRLVHARLRVLDGMVAYYAGRLADARQCLSAARPELETIGAVPELWQALRIDGWCAARMGCPAEETAALVEAATTLLDRMTASLDGADRAVFLLNKWSADEEALAGRVDALAALRETVARSRWPLSLLRRRALRRQVLALLALVESHRDKMAGSVGAGTRAGAVPAEPRPGQDTAIIAFLVLPDRTVVIRVAQGRIDHAVAPVSRLRLRELVAACHRAVGSGGTVRDLGALDDGPASDAAGSREAAIGAIDALSAALGLPAIVAALPRPVEAITFLPDDVLHGFPFAALRVGGGWLVERFAVSVGFSARPPAPAAPARGGALLVAVPHGGPGIPPLPNTVTEIERLEPCVRRLGIHRIATHPDGLDKPAALAAVPAASVVHLACHGVFRPDEPDQSGLWLVRPDGGAEILSLAELGRLDLRAVRHVTLSSCWSADNFALPGRHVLSLPETLWRAGAGSVLGCLWPVDDQLAVSFMESFYAQLATLPPDRALRAAQLRFLREDGGAADVFAWAGFTLYGDTTRMTPRERGAPLA